jgi:hypothetical protein
MEWLNCHQKTVQLNNSIKTAPNSSQAQHRHPHMLLMAAGVQHRAWTSRQAAQHNNRMTALCSGTQHTRSAYKQVRGVNEVSCDSISSLSSICGPGMPVSKTST